MKMKRWIPLFVLLACARCMAQTYTAASCAQSDVNAVINGPTHTAVNGDTIVIPACPTVSITAFAIVSDVITFTTGTNTLTAGGGQYIPVAGITGTYSYLNGVYYTTAATSTSFTAALTAANASASISGSFVAPVQWTSGITVPANIGITIKGTGTAQAGTGNVGASASCQQTVLTDDLSSGHMFTMSPEYASPNQEARISCIQFLATNPWPGYNQPINIVGTCTSSGCPNFRLDNTTEQNQLGHSVSDGTFADIVDVFGVADHNSVGDSSIVGNGLILINPNLPAYLGVGHYGDNSWSQADTLGTAQSYYLENNAFTNAVGTDVDGGDNFTDTGGGRFVCRFNTFDGVTEASACTNHGSESGGRPRGGRQAEDYMNSLVCTTSAGCASAFGVRSGVLYVFGNQLSSTNGGFYTNIASLGVFRGSSLDFVPWYGQGFGPYDEMAGGSQTSSFALSGVSGTCLQNNCTLTASSQSWTTNQFAPGSTYYDVFDVTSAALAGIASNTATSLTLSWCGGAQQSSGGSVTCAEAFSSSDTVVILGRTSYASGTYTGTTGSTSFVDSTQSWTTNQWVSTGVAYILMNTTQGWACEIASNTATTITCGYGPHSNWANQGITAEWTNGDNYIIVQVQAYMDPESRNGGTNFASAGCGSSVLPPTCVGYPSQTLDPSYEFMDSYTGSVNQNPATSGTLTQIANRDYYQESKNQAAQTSPTSPFNGTTGNGHGTLAYRPTSCTTGVGYFATDQGSWNQSGGSNPAGYSGQGELFTCTATNTWTLDYTPYTYPHPLDTGGAVSTGGSSPVLIANSLHHNSADAGARR